MECGKLKLKVLIQCLKLILFELTKRKQRTRIVPVYWIFSQDQFHYEVERQQKRLSLKFLGHTP